jgi:hypothetical protein
VLGTVCGFENPEDVEAVPAAGLVLVSEMRPLIAGAGGGRLDALPIGGRAARRLWPADGAVRAPLLGDPACTAPPPDDAFAPHGITSRPTESPGTIRVAVVHHRVRESIELFDLEGTGTTARLVWRGCVPLPAGTRGNDVALAPDGEIVASNWVPSLEGLSGIWSLAKGGAGGTTGDVMAWRAGRGWRHLPGTTAAHPNGVAVSPDGATVYYAEAGASRVVAVPRDGAATDGARRQGAVPGSPDNLAWSPRGTLLVGTHTAGAKPVLCMLGRTPCRASWSLVEVDPATLAARETFHHDGTVVGAVASATEIDGCTYFGSVFDDRIGVRCEERRAP